MEEINNNNKRVYKDDIDNIDLALARFFFGCNISFNIVESELFKKFVQLLNPNYKTPTRKRLSNQLLDKIHQEVQSYAKNDDETDGILMIDGWKNSAANTKLVVCKKYLS